MVDDVDKDDVIFSYLIYDFIFLYAYIYFFIVHIVHKLKKI